jgi:transposase InsO family protein
MVVARKPNGKVRICLDPRTINPWIEREYMQIPDIDSILLDLEKAKVFTLIDLQAAFWQVGVDDESARLLTFATPWGRFQYNRLPFGISIAPEIFHKAVTDLLQGIPGVVVYVDDIFIYAETIQEHDERYAEVKKRLEAGGFTWNRTKCHERQNEVKFLGHVIGGGQVRPDPEKIRALLEFPEPKSRKELKGFVGLVSWLRKFLPELNQHLSVFRPLMRERTPWVWTVMETEAFAGVKKTLEKVVPLMMIKAGELLVLAVDASSFGLGAALLQRDANGDERPVFFASRLLNDAEKDYPQIDKEFLAIVWALERLDAFVYGQQLTIRTDHRPLLGIMKKSMAHMSTRQQRFVAQAMRYSCTLEYLPGREMVVADFLSRAVNRQGPECICKMMNTDIRLEEAFISMIESVQISDEISNRVRQEASADEQYQAVVRAYMTGFVACEAPKLDEYWSVRDQLSCEDGLLYYQGCLVIPRAARPRILESLHRGHVGVYTMTKRARETVWWPGMNNDMKIKAARCAECQTELPMQRREPMLSFEVPQAPGLVVHADYFELAAKEYLLLVDGYSAWTEVLLPRNRRPAELTRVMREYMSRNGVPRVFHSDQGSTFMAGEFRAFCKAWGIQVTEGSAKHPRGNAIAETYVKKIKRILRTARDDDDLAKAILALRQTPLAPGRPSPAQLHLGRNLRDELHTRVEKFDGDWREIRQWREAMAASRKKQFDRGTGVLSELAVGTLVLAWHNEWWERATVVAKLARPRSYTVKLCMSGRLLERNRHLIREIDPESLKPQPRKANPSNLFQARPFQPIVQVLMPMNPDGGAASTAPRSQPGRTERSMSPDHEISPGANDVPGDDGNMPRHGTPAPASSRATSSTPGSGVTSRLTLSASDSLPLSPGSSGADSEPASPQMWTPDKSTSSDDAEDEESSPPTSATPVVTTRTGRNIRPRQRYSPSDYR